MLIRSLRLLLLALALCTTAFASASWPQIFGDDMNQFADGALVKTDEAGFVYIAVSVYDDQRQNPAVGVVKYNRAGVLQWSSIYGGASDNYQSPQDMVIDHQKNVYVTFATKDNGPYQWGTAKFDRDGELRWIRYRHSATNVAAAPRAMQLTAEGNIVVLGTEDAGSIAEFALVEYQPNGVVRWVGTYASGRNESVSSLAIDSDGSIAVGGTIGDFATEDFLTLKYDSEGNLLWVKTLDGPLHAIDAVDAVAFDSQHNVVVTGDVASSSVVGDCMTVKYDPDGNKLWQARYGTASLDEETRFISIDHQDNIIVAAVTFEPDHGGYLAIKYSPTGTRLWAKSFDARVPSISYQSLAGLAVDTDDNVYVGGWYYDRFAQRYRMILLKYGSEGNRKSATLRSADYEQSTTMSAMTLDPITNHVFAVGSGNVTGLSQPVAFTARF